ncbi:putative aspartate aminotransferase [Trypoxylus dichotomus]
MSAWSEVPMGSPDAITGVLEMYRACKNPNKVNLIVGTYRDDDDKPHVWVPVQKAERILSKMVLDKDYLPQTGMPKFCKLTAAFIFGKDAEVIENGSLASLQTLSASGGLRVGCEFIKKYYNGPKTIYVSVPTWENHIQIAQSSYLDVKGYRYYNFKTRSLDFEGLMEDVNKMADKSIMVLHVCAHNMSGVDPSHEQWNEISAMCKKKQILVFFDNAYQGITSGDPDYDVYSVRKFVADGNLIMIAQSFSKNMGLYGERVGGLHILTENKEQCQKVLSQIRFIVRSMYSSPPLMGARIVTKVMEDPELMNDWRMEFQQVSARLKNIRLTLYNSLKKLGSTRDWDHILKQIGEDAFTLED